MIKEQYAVLQWAQGVSGEDSLLAWAGVRFQTFGTYAEAFEDAKRVNRIFVQNGLPACAFVGKGKMTSHLGFILSEE